MTVIPSQSVAFYFMKAFLSSMGISYESEDGAKQTSTLTTIRPQMRLRESENRTRTDHC